MPPKKLQFTHSTLFHADPSRIYNALATSEGLNSWFTTSSTVNAVPGGEIVFHWEDWDQTTVDIQIEPAEDDTIVRLDEHGYSDFESALATMLNRANGWGEALTLLKFYLELGAHYLR